MGAKARLICGYSSCSLLFITLSCLFLILIGCGNGGGGGTVPPPSVSTENKLNVEILGASISSNPVVTFRLSDDRGNPIDKDAAGVVFRFIIATIKQGEDQYTDYITGPAGADSEGSSTNPLGTFTNLGNGVYTYTFNKALPEDFDRNATHTVGIFARRDIGNQRFVANATFDFVPSGGPVTIVRDIVRTETCNNCHDPLKSHGGIRRDVKLCVLCHTPQTTDPDTGNTVDLKVMIHKIHRGAELPSVEIAGIHYQIEDEDFSTVEFPQDIRNCTKCHTGGTQSDNFKTEPSRAACGSCHDDINFASGGSNFPGGRSHGGGIQLDDNNCSACHLPSTGKEFDISVEGAHTIPLKSVQAPGVNFEIVKVESFEEPGNPQVAPGRHPVVTFNIKTDAGEVIPPASLNFLRLTLAGPTFEYNIQDYNGDGKKIPGDPTSPWFIIIPGEVPSPGIKGGEAFIQEDPRQSAVDPDGDGNFAYTFIAMIPNDATGTYTIGIEGYKCATVQGANQRKGGTNCDGTRDSNGNGREDSGEVFNQVRDAGHNVVFDFPVTDFEDIPRRMVVDTSTKCINCHGVFSKDFSVHGGIRNDSEYCVLCHNPAYDTLTRQVPGVGETALTKSVNFRVYIHKIHTGEDLTIKPYELYSPPGLPPGGTSPNDLFERAVDFAEVRFPGDTRDCEACHLHGTNILNPGKGVLGFGVLSSTNHEFERGQSTKTITEDLFTTPIISVCTACHEKLVVNEAGNALTGENHLGGPQPESACIECHIAGDPLGVEEVHLPPLSPEERINRPQPIE